jgi:hypothetical protein
VERSEAESSYYELPFEYIRKYVKPVRDKSRDDRMRKYWWLHGRSRPALRAALVGKSRCIVTPEVAKHRLFVWMGTGTIPDHKLHVFARDDDYFFGVLHSRVHEVWSLAQCSWIGVGNDPSYSSSRTFGTFPMPWSPGLEPAADPIVLAIAVSDLNEKREAWLNPPGAAQEELAGRTLTNLYNARPSWLEGLHKMLDNAVFGAYGRSIDLTDDELLRRLLDINQERASLWSLAPLDEAQAP